MQIPFNKIKSIDDKNKMNANNPAVKMDAPFNIKCDFYFYGIDGTKACIQLKLSKRN